MESFILVSQSAQLSHYAALLYYTILYCIASIDTAHMEIFKERNIPAL